jgi:hypothetical protein
MATTKRRPRKLPRPPRVPADTVPSPKSPPRNGKLARLRHDVEVALQETRTLAKLQRETLRRTELVERVLARFSAYLLGVEG